MRRSTFGMAAGAASAAAGGAACSLSSTLPNAGRPNEMSRFSDRRRAGRSKGACRCWCGGPAPPRSGPPAAAASRRPIPPALGWHRRYAWPKRPADASAPWRRRLKREQQHALTGEHSSKRLIAASSRSNRALPASPASRRARDRYTRSRTRPRSRHAAEGRASSATSRAGSARYRPARHRPRPGRGGVQPLQQLVDHLALAGSVHAGDQDHGREGRFSTRSSWASSSLVRSSGSAHSRTLPQRACARSAPTRTSMAPHACTPCLSCRFRRTARLAAAPAGGKGWVDQAMSRAFVREDDPTGGAAVLPDRAISPHPISSRGGVCG